MKILVTGGAGFIGSHLTDKLIEKGYKVVIIDNLSTGKKENLNSKAEFYRTDICDSGIGRIFEKEKPDFVFHLAAQIDLRKSVENPVFDADVNLLGTINILENCRKNNIKKIIFTSSGGAIYGEAEVIPTSEDYFPKPLSPYGINKLSAENYFNYYYKNFDLPFVSLRLANVYGPRQNPSGEAGIIAIFSAKMLSKEQSIINGNGKQTRDFVFIDDVVEANILALKEKTGIFNIGTAKETDINAIFREIKKLTESDCQEKHGPPKKGEQKRSCINYSKARTQLAWQPKYSLTQGLKKTVEWFKNN